MSTTITVTSATELKQALSQATGGETILLAAGDYGKLVIKDTQFASNVTIKSADPNAMASFSEAYLNNASNITFDEIMFDYTYSLGDAHYGSRFQILYSNDITIDNSVFDGDFASGTGTSADGTGFGKGLVIRGSDNVDVTNTEFHSWWKALGAVKSTGINFSGNDIHTIRSDGITLGQVQDVLIENNYIHDFGGAAGSGDHRDMIQVQRSSGTGSSDIIIRNNVLDMGSGDYTQGIWFGGDKAQYSNPADWHYNITIENNVIYNAHANGLAVHQVDGLTISNNTLIAVPRAETGGITIPKISLSGGLANVTVEQNIAPAIIGPDMSTWTMLDNVIIQKSDPSAPDHYDNVFEYIATAAVDGYNQYGVIPGSLADLLDAGSSLVDGYPFDYNSWVGASTTTGGSSGGSGTNNPSPTPPDSGTSTPPDSGTSTSPDSGTSTSPDSGTSTPPDSGDAGSGGSQSLMVFDDFVLDIAGLPHSGQARLMGDAHVVDTETGSVVHFDGDKDQMKLGRLEQFEDSGQLAFTVEFARDEADGSAQRVVWNTGHLGLTLVEDGLKVHVGNNDFKFHKGFSVEDLGLNDTEKHEITVMVDQDADRMQVLVDGDVVLDRTDVDVDITGGMEWGWDIGFNRRDYVDGNLSGFAIDDEVQFVDTMSGSVDLLG